MYLIFPKDCAFSVGDLVTMISAALDATPIVGEFEGFIEYTWGRIELVSYDDGLVELHLTWGKLSEIYEPALSWGAIEAPSL